MALHPHDVRRIDANSVYLGVPTSALMASAGHQVAEHARQMAPTDSTVVVVAGLGNNGGDGLVAAQELSSDHRVHVILAGPSTAWKTPEADGAFHSLHRRRVQVHEFDDPADSRHLLSEADMVIDAMLGIGIHGTLRQPVRSLVRQINSCGRPILSVDVPTGFGTKLCVRPDVTVTLGDRKHGMDQATCGRISVVDIGIPPDAEARCGPGDLSCWWKPNPTASRKGRNGRLLVIGGGPYGGAAILSSTAALGTGCDLVHLYTPEDVAPAALAASPDLVVHAGVEDWELVPDDTPHIARILKKVDAVLVGPGVGKSKKTSAVVAWALEATRAANIRVVVDADALAIGAKLTGLLKGRREILTPHAAEFRRIAGKPLPKDTDAAWSLLQSTARRLGCVILLKGPVDRIADANRRRENHVHHPMMTRGGTGDVLSGTAAGFLARGADEFAAAASAAFVVGSAGVRLATEMGPGMLASSIAREIGPEVHRWTR